MKWQINSLFEPGLVWEGEIHRQMAKLERKLGVLSASRINLECSLWRDSDSKASIDLTLDLGDVQFREKAMDSSEVTATKRAFSALDQQVEQYLNHLRERNFWSRTSGNEMTREYFRECLNGIGANEFTSNHLAVASVIAESKADSSKTIFSRV